MDITLTREGVLALASALVALAIAHGMLTQRIPVSEGAFLLSTLLVTGSVVRKRNDDEK